MGCGSKNRLPWIMGIERKANTSPRRVDSSFSRWSRLRRQVNGSVALSGMLRIARPLRPARLHADAPIMFSLSDAEATAIRHAFEESGELAAVAELRRYFPAITDPMQARLCVRTIAGWRPIPTPDQSALPRRTRKSPR
jgi:hypothetical protein